MLYCARDRPCRVRRLNLHPRGAMTRALALLTLIATLAAMPAFGQPPADGPGKKMPDRGQQHVQQGTAIPYEDSPPTSGPHWPVVAKWGVYPEEVPAEVFVHNLEHGGVVILYHCPTPCPQVVREIEETLQTLPMSKFGHLKVVV